jgi:glycerol-3-phosphate dehydrogenase (NAD+)
VAKIAAENLKEHGKLFHPILNLWVHEEIIDGEKLSTIINTKRENVKYVWCPGSRLHKISTWCEITREH